MKIKEMTSKIEEFAPLSVSLEAISRGSHDNSGHLVGDSNLQLKGIVVCIDVCDSAISQAINEGCNLILSHHPFIYHPISDLTNETYKGRLIEKIIKNDLVVYSAHLSMDMTIGGIDDVFAKMCKINVEKIFEQMSYGGYGKLGYVEKMSFDEYLKIINSEFKSVSAIENKKIISKVASFCGGGLSVEAVEFAIKNNADAVISCDIPHHLVVELSENNINVINLQHGESELLAFWNIIESLNLDTKIVLCQKDFRLINR